MMFVRDNAEDYAESITEFQEAWHIMGLIACPPSLEVFETGYDEEEKDEPGLTPQQYAWKYANGYRRTDNFGFWKFDQDAGRLVPK